MARDAGAGLVLLAQHADDQAETVLLQALRGAGPAGLAGMPARWDADGLHWARPWLHRPRAQLRAASFAGTLFENLPSGLADMEADGIIGAPLLARWRLRFDFPGGKLLLAPAG